MPELPPGFFYYPDFLDMEEHDRLLEFVRGLPYRSFVMQGVQAKRRIVHYGYHYSIESFRLTEAEPFPANFVPLRDRVAATSETSPAEWAEALVTEYSPGAAIGWHKDAPPFGLVAGISLGNPCRMRSRHPSLFENTCY